MTYGGGSTNDIGLVDSLEWNTVDTVWSSHKQQARFELFEEDNSLATEWSGEEDTNGTRGEGGSKRSGTGVLVVLDRGWCVLGWVVLGLCGNGSGLAVAGTTDGLYLCGGGSSGGLDASVLLCLVQLLCLV